MSDRTPWLSGPVLLMFSTCVFAIRLPYEFAENVEKEYTLPDLPYDYKDLEPYIDEATVRVHHTGHHAAYTKKMNIALNQWRTRSPDDELLNKNLLDILVNIEEVAEEYQTQIRNNGGGYVNHNFYWSVMSPNQHLQERNPSKTILMDIERDFGNFSSFKTMFNSQAMSLFGSGVAWEAGDAYSSGEPDLTSNWFGGPHVNPLISKYTQDWTVLIGLCFGYVWLSRQPEDGRLMVSTTANQDSPLTQGLHPILVLDVWEHAYYLKHQNKRSNHVADWWNLVDWKIVEEIDTWWHESYKQFLRDEL